MSRREKQKRDKGEDVEIELPEIPAEPWGPLFFYAYVLLNTSDKYMYIGNFSSKQARFVPQMMGLIDVSEDKLGIQIPWLSETMKKYLVMSKSVDGWAAKEVGNVIKESGGRIYTQLSRLKRLIYGREPGAGEY